jgi:NAD(P)H-flavin reductase
VGFLIGMVAGAFGVAYLRPIAKAAIKGGIRFANTVREVQAEVAEDFADLKAEAEADLRTEEHKAAPAHKKSVH